MLTALLRKLTHLQMPGGKLTDVFLISSQGIPIAVTMKNSKNLNDRQFVIYRGKNDFKNNWTNSFSSKY